MIFAWYQLVDAICSCCVGMPSQPFENICGAISRQQSTTVSTCHQHRIHSLGCCQSLGVSSPAGDYIGIGNSIRLAVELQISIP